MPAAQWRPRSYADAAAAPALATQSGTVAAAAAASSPEADARAILGNARTLGDAVVCVRASGHDPHIVELSVVDAAWSRQGQAQRVRRVACADAATAAALVDALARAMIRPTGSQ